MTANLRAKLMTALVIVVVIAIASAVWNWFNPKDMFTPDNEYKEITDITKKGLSGKLFGKKYKLTTAEINVPLTVIDKTSIKSKHIPVQVKNNEDEEIAATGVVEPYHGKTDVTATVDKNTGKAHLYSKRRPLPFLEFINKKEIGIRGGLIINNDTLTQIGVDIYSRWTFLRVGSVHFALYGEANSRPEAKAMLELSYRW